MELGKLAFLYAVILAVAVLLYARLVRAWRHFRQRQASKRGIPELKLAPPLHEKLINSVESCLRKPFGRLTAFARGRHQHWQAIVELALLAVWAVWVGRAYLNLDPNVVPGGREYSSAIQTHHIWTWVRQCGVCALWNGAERGGYPSFADVHGSALHPLVIATTWIWGVVNGSKVALVVALWTSGVAQWWLARVMKLGWLPRLWGGLMGVVGGHLAGRMELGAFGVVLSVAMCSLVFAAALSVARSGSRRATILLAVTLALSAVAGQGYIQFGLLCAAPAFLFLVLDKDLHLRPVWREYAIAVGLALLLAASFLVPLSHFLPNLAKDADPTFAIAQPLEYVPLNLVIRDYEFLNSEALSKSSFPHLNATYIGWAPVLLAALCLRFARREDSRMLLFLAASALLALFTASAVILRWIQPLVPAVAWVRHPPQIAALAVPPILGLAAYGLDGLLTASWPRLNVGFQASPDQRKRTVSAKWLLLIPLVWNLHATYVFSHTWLYVTRISEDMHTFLQTLRTPSLQWVEPPFGEHFWIEPALRMGLKLSPGIMTWRWRDRPFPAPYLEANRSDPPPDSIEVNRMYGIPIYRFDSHRDYAFVQTDGETIPCRASGTGGDLLVECSTAGNGAGTLTVRENSWTGWYAWRDQERVPLLNDRWLSVDAPTGDHSYRFRYLPWDAPLGIFLSLLGVALSIWQWFKYPSSQTVSVMEVK